MQNKRRLMMELNPSDYPRDATAVQWAYDCYCLDRENEDVKTLLKLRVPLDEVLAQLYFKGLYNKVHREGFTLIQTFGGRHRASKSVTSALEGYMLDKTFFPNIENRIIKDHQQFFDALEWIMKTRTVGAYLQIDEAGASMASSDWAEKWAADVSKATQQLGYLLPYISFTSPSKKFIMSKLRQMVHLDNFLSRPNKFFSYMQPYYFIQDSIMGNEYHPQPRIPFCGNTYVLKRIKITKPPQFLIDAYEDVAGDMKENNIKGYIANSREKPVVKKEPLNVDAAAQTVASTPQLFMALDSKRKILSNDLIKAHFDDITDGGITHHQMKVIKQRALQLLNDKKKIEEEKKE